MKCPSGKDCGGYDHCESPKACHALRESNAKLQGDGDGRPMVADDPPSDDALHANIMEERSARTNRNTD